MTHRTAIITGGSRGLGLALARSLVGDGWRVVIDARTATDLDQAAEEPWGPGGGRHPQRVARAGGLHLHLLEAVAGRPLLERSYAHALAGPYRWHEFGDFHLILP